MTYNQRRQQKMIVSKLMFIAVVDWMLCFCCYHHHDPSFVRGFHFQSKILRPTTSMTTGSSTVTYRPKHLIYDNPVFVMKNPNSNNIHNNNVPSVTHDPTGSLLTMIIRDDDYDMYDTRNNNDIISKGKFDGNKFGFVERIDSIKSFMIGAIVGGVALAPISAVHELVFPTLAESNGLAQFEFDTDMGSIQAGLFSIIYRYCIREDNNPQLNSGIVGGFIIIRTLSRIMVPSYCTAVPLSCGAPLQYFDYNMIYQCAFHGIESVALFGVTAYVLDYMMKKQWIGKFPG